MSKRNDHGRTQCLVCGKTFARRDLIPGAIVRPTIAQEILNDHPSWSADAFICRSDLARYRADYVHSLLESEKGELTSLEEKVLESLREHALLTEYVDEAFEEKWTLGERLADHLAEFGGSWRFVILFAVFLTLWIVANSLMFLWRPVDPYPYILLNLVLSCLAAMQAPIIMMSQNRQEARDRVRAQHDYQVNLKAELEIRHLHEKIDHLLSHQWERLVDIQEIQLELLAELGRRRL